MGFEPMNTGFADQRVSHFAIGALVRRTTKVAAAVLIQNYRGCDVVRRYGFTVL